VIESKAPMNILLPFTTVIQMLNQGVSVPTGMSGLYIDGGALFLFLFLGKQKKKEWLL
jgi:hypothetical protein